MEIALKTSQNQLFQLFQIFQPIQNEKRRWHQMNYHNIFILTTKKLKNTSKLLLSEILICRNSEISFIHMKMIGKQCFQRVSILMKSVKETNISERWVKLNNSMLWWIKNGSHIMKMNWKDCTLTSNSRNQQKTKNLSNGRTSLVIYQDENDLFWIPYIKIILLRWNQANSNPGLALIAYNNFFFNTALFL